MFRCCSVEFWFLNRFEVSGQIGSSQTLPIEYSPYVAGCFRGPYPKVHHTHPTVALSPLTAYPYGEVLIITALWSGLSRQQLATSTAYVWCFPPVPVHETCR